MGIINTTDQNFEEDVISSQIPDAELHIFSGSKTYGEYGKAKESIMKPILEKARALAKRGVILREPVPARNLIVELLSSRVIVYKGDSNETFCSSLAEAQACGVPAIVQDLGCVAERVILVLSSFLSISKIK